MASIKGKGTSLEIKLRFIDIFKKLGYVRSEQHENALEAGLVEMLPLSDLSETHEILAIYEDNKLIISPKHERVGHNSGSKPVRMYSDKGRIYVLFKSDAGETIAALYSDIL